MLDAIRMTWKHSASEKVSVVIATATTHAALAAMRRAQKELLDAVQLDGPQDNCCPELAVDFIATRMIEEGTNPIRG